MKKPIAPVKPNIKDFGLTKSEVEEVEKVNETNYSSSNYLKGSFDKYTDLIIFIAFPGSMVLSSLFLWFEWHGAVFGFMEILSSLFVGSIMVGPVIGFFIIIFCAILYNITFFITQKIESLKIKMHPLYSKYKKYKSALDRYDGLYKYYTNNLARYIHEVELEKQRQTYQYWIGLNPYQFEKEITKLFKKNGFIAQTTKGSGDGGIDIHVEKQFKKGIVQCKKYSKKLGPAAIRDLYGTMIGGKYDYAYIVCPTGFSEQSHKFTQGKKICLIGLERIMNMMNQPSTKNNFLDFKL